LIQINNVGYRTSINTLQVDPTIAKPFEHEPRGAARLCLAARHQLRFSKKQIASMEQIQFLAALAVADALLIAPGGMPERAASLQSQRF
jgi:hypothetical protein